ncbi:TlpA disulfide reductase family protein [uncultured Muribaculum sp.]|uniref:TlpA family protein disulfide reductase n=2 Tax=uncultured Muribaculum sp. TaxID=1918613 RepID=UPI0025B1EB60|nr:TlpA disulfide reductase family protein [uncultured Muribaculum sp.]
MKNFILSFIIALSWNISMAITPTRYFIGKTEVPESLWMSTPDSLKYSTLKIEYDSLTVIETDLPMTHYLDSINGGYIIKKRSEEEISAIEKTLGISLKNHTTNVTVVSINDKAPQINLVKYADNFVITDFIVPGNCYLLSFWATWCGNCLIELKEEFIPSIANEFKDIPIFKFVPICIDSTESELEKFFKSTHGSKWHHLSQTTYLDTNRLANSKYAKSGIMPLNIVIGKDGVIKYIHSGKITAEEELSELRNAIISGL